MSTCDPCDKKGSVVVKTSILSGVPVGTGERGPAGCPTISISRVIENPVAGRAYLAYFNTDTEVEQLNVLTIGGAPSVSFQLRHGFDFSGVGDAMFASELTVSNQSTGATFPPTAEFILAEKTVPAGAHLWADISAVDAGTVIINVVYKPTCTDTVGEVGVFVQDEDGNGGVIPLVDI